MEECDSVINWLSWVDSSGGEMVSLQSLLQRLPYLLQNSGIKPIHIVFTS